MDREQEFNNKLSTIAQNMSSGFVRAYNAMLQEHELGSLADEGTYAETIMENNNYKFSIDFKGSKSDLFARTFESALKNSGAINSVRIATQDDKGKYGRRVEGEVPIGQAADFLKKLEELNTFVQKEQKQLSTLYDAGVVVQTMAYAGGRTGTKFFVHISKDESSEPYFQLSLKTNDQALHDKLEVYPSEVSIGKKRKSFEINKEEYEGGWHIAANNKPGNQIIYQAIKALADEKNISLGSESRGWSR